jgi:hypothetical protein
MLNSADSKHPHKRKTPDDLFNNGSLPNRIRQIVRAAIIDIAGNQHLVAWLYVDSVHRLKAPVPSRRECQTAYSAASSSSADPIR